ncbi:AI-2E family transporter [Halovivax cerinus]|uniref:AI-2E family transporter n=1 Tax=Halovivax cerinus TaxID=1487865 RepID=A0ABD5NJ96_9EURY|nr:AI-2E family transporter [Halovivax cerinus]
MNRATGTLLALIGALSLLSVLLILPFVQYVLFAILLAYVLRPLQGPLQGRTSPAIAALSLVVLAIALFVVPIAVIVALVAEEAVAFASDVDPSAEQLQDVERLIADVTGYQVDLASRAADVAARIGDLLLGQTTEIFAQITHTVIGLGTALFLLYYFLKDGHRLVAWLRDVTPLPPDLQDRLFDQIDDVMRAVLLGHVFIAFVQGLLAGLGLLATGVPNAAFWTVVMMILALVPLVGAFLVWGPAVVYLYAIGDPYLSGGLFLYSAIVVSISDDYLRPIVVDRYARLSPAVIILGVLGGAYAFGIMGLFYGPVVLGALLTAVDVLDEYWDRQASPFDRH